MPAFCNPGARGGVAQIKLQLVQKLRSGGIICGAIVLGKELKLLIRAIGQHESAARRNLKSFHRMPIAVVKPHHVENHTAGAHNLRHVLIKTGALALPLGHKLRMPGGPVPLIAPDLQVLAGEWLKPQLHMWLPRAHVRHGAAKARLLRSI